VSLALDRTGPSRLHPSGRYGIDHFFELLEKSPSAETEPWIFNDRGEIRREESR
jgi:hypothetical protein